MSEFLTIGEPIALFASEDADASLVDAVDFHKYLAGAEVNVTVGVSRLGHSTQYTTRLGQDPFGDFILKQLKQNNIGTDYIKSTDQYWTAFQLKQRVTHGDPGIYYYRKNSAAAHYEMSQLDAIDFDTLKIAHLSGIFPAISKEAKAAFEALIKQLQDHSITTVFDPNLRPQLWASKEEMIKTINALASQANYVIPGINEGKILVGSDDPETIADFYLDRSDFTHTVIVKVGAEGAFIKDDEGHKAMIPGFKVDKVVDTVGAGDGFAVGLITGLLENLSIDDAVKRGNAIGAMAVQAPGDNDGYPTQDQLKAFLAKNQN